MGQVVETRDEGAEAFAPKELSPRLTPVTGALEKLAKPVYDVSSWTEMLQIACRRPEMFVGDLDRAHERAVSEPLRLFWEARVFRSPKAARVYLSDQSFLVVGIAGPLKTEIAAAFPFSGTGPLMEDWGPVISNYWDTKTSARQPEWRRRFASATGPTMHSPFISLVFTRSFLMALRIPKGLVWQSFRDGYPEVAPVLDPIASPTALIAAGCLLPDHFPGLPYTQELADRLAQWPSTVVHRTSEDFFDPTRLLNVLRSQDPISELGDPRVADRSGDH
ncbi:MAG: hypothetical protein LC772_02395 [Chloroflexi bacterium]|nr:hypothetical protein [Chloroflexota bacterium]